MEDKVVKIIHESVLEVTDQFKNIQELNDNTELFGKSGVLDSLGLVTLLVTIEQEVEDGFDKSITLADEKAMSQKNSPFKTVGTLTTYVQTLLKQ